MQRSVISARGRPADAGRPGRHGQAVLGDRVNRLYAGTLLSLALSLAVALVYVELLADAVPAAQGFAWFGGMALVLLLRAAGAAWFRRRRDRHSDRTWLRLFRLGSGLTAATWGLAGVLFFPGQGETIQVVSVLILAGVSAGALSVMGSDFPSYRNFALLVLLPVALLALLDGGQVQLVIGILVLLLLAFLLRSAQANARAISEALALHHENAALLVDLAREKDHALGEARTMISTVLSSAPIALWAIDSRGVIRFMEGERLGREGGLGLPEVGHDLFEAFADQPQVIYETRRALAGETFTTEIDLYGNHYEVHYSPLPGEDGAAPGAICVAVDISERKRQARELSRRANYDELTGLANRSLIMGQLAHAIDNARRQHLRVAVCFLDLDNFKGLNDSLGHLAGDDMLRQTAGRLRAAMRDSDMPARLGGDEFLVVSEGLHRAEDAEVIAHKITHLFHRPFDIEQRDIRTTTSVGIAVFPDDGDTPEQLLQSADTAMYHAKQAGKNQYRFFTRSMQDVAERHLAMEIELRNALQRGELRLMYQPKVDVRSGQIRGAEALLRWASPSLGQVTPDDFIPVAEFAGLMPQIGDWVLRTACMEAASWPAVADQPLHVAINVSPQQFRSTDLLANVTQALVDSGLAPAQLELEITESVLVQDAPETLRVFDALSELGVRLSLDDFGTGYSSLSYLKRFPMQVLKIDKSFIGDLGGTHDDDSLVEAIIAMAHSLHMQIVAEGVETPEQLAFLRARNVQLIQGFLFSRPVEASPFRELLAAGGLLGDAAERPGDVR